MLQIAKADVQIPEQDPQEMGNIYFALENHINLVQASQTPDNTKENASKWRFLFSSSVMNEVHIKNQSEAPQEINQTYSFLEFLKYQKVQRE